MSVNKQWVQELELAAQSTSIEDRGLISALAVGMVFAQASQSEWGKNVPEATMELFWRANSSAPHDVEMAQRFWTGWYAILTRFQNLPLSFTQAYPDGMDGFIDVIALWGLHLPMNAVKILKDPKKQAGLRAYVEVYNKLFTTPKTKGDEE